MKLNRNIKHFINYFLGPLLFIWLSWSIYRQIKHQPDLEKAWFQIRESLKSISLGNLLAVFLLMLVNWGIEARKWQLVVRKVQRVDFFKAFKAILSGVSFSVSTPNRVGEYFGRILYMDEGNRLKTISLTIVCSISQIIITLVMGVIGLLFLLPKIESLEIISFPWNKVIIYGTLLVGAVVILFYFRLSMIVKWFHRIPGTKRYIYLVEALESLGSKLLLQLLLLSGFRFLIFIVQYYLLFLLFRVDISFTETFLAASISFLVLAVIPSFAIADIGLRSETGLRLFGLFSGNGLGILMTSVTVWFINLILPAIVGSLLILSIRKMWRTEKVQGTGQLPTGQAGKAQDLVP